MQNIQQAGADANGMEQHQLQLIVELLQASREENRGLRAHMQQQSAAATADAACMIEFEVDRGPVAVCLNVACCKALA